MGKSAAKTEAVCTISKPGLALKADLNPRWVRVLVNGITVADSKSVIILHERGHLPVYYFPEQDVRTDLLTRSETASYCPRKGDAVYFHLQAGERTVEDAVWSYPDTVSGSEAIQGYYAFYWNKVDRWLEEEEEIFVHPRDPYKRVDAIQSSRHIEIILNGHKLAESRRPVIVFETGVPVRYYLPPEDVSADLLETSDLHTSCPYKGTASYWHVLLEDRKHENLVWSYLDPIPEIPKIKNLLSFYNEKVEVFVDGEKQPEPAWYRSALDFFDASEVRRDQ